MLVEHFLGVYGSGHRLAQETMDALLAYEWPGNVRELENCIQNMVAVHTGPLLTRNDLPSSIQNHLFARKAQALSVAVGSAGMPAVHPPAAKVEAPAPCVTDPPVLPLVELEKRAIRQALEYTRGDRGIAASLLGIGRTTLYRKLKEYELAC